MKERDEMLEVVDENDNVVGLKTRERIHKEGLLHREINVWFLTPNGEMIFQHRAKDKDTYPDLLDATVGGHVEPGMSYEETAIRECKEETGIDIDPRKLVTVSKKRRKSFDEATGRINNTFSTQYAYLFNSPLDGLKTEQGKSEGFEAWSMDAFQKLSSTGKGRFISFYLSDEFLKLFKKIKLILIK